MAILEGSVLCRPAAPIKYAGAPAAPISSPLVKTGNFRSGFWGMKTKCSSINKVSALSFHTRGTKGRPTRCSFSSSSDGNGSRAGNFSENDEEYVNSSVIEAVEVRSGSDGFMIKMRDGRHLRCVHNSPQGGSLPDYAPHPAIVLKMEDGSDLLLPIIVLEMPSALLMAAVRNVQIARPTIYQVVKEMIEKMGYVVQLVRVTKRVHEAYFAQLYLAKLGDEKESISFDLRPSDAINMAVRCKRYATGALIEHYTNHTSSNSRVPIQVNRQLAYSDGMRVVEPSKVLVTANQSDGMLFTELDKPNGQPCLETKEFGLIKNMLIAVVEERYKDAAQWRDQLVQFRTKRKNWT